MGAAGIVLVDLEDLADAAAHARRPSRVRAFSSSRLCSWIRSCAASRSGTSFWAPTTKMTFAAPQAYAASWLPERGGDDERSVAGHRVNAAEGEVGLADDRLHLLLLGRAVERERPSCVPSRSARRRRPPRRFRSPQGHRRVGHHRRALRDAVEHALAGRIQVVDDLDAESALFECADGLRERPIVGQCGESVGLSVRACMVGPPSCWLQPRVAMATNGRRREGTATRRPPRCAAAGSGARAPRARARGRARTRRGPRPARPTRRSRSARVEWKYW